MSDAPTPPQPPTPATGHVRTLLDLCDVMAAEINRLNRRHLANIAERDRARESAAAAEAKLPRLRDGAEPVSGTTIWRRIDATFAVAGTVEGWEKPHTDEPWWVQCREWSSPLCDCYSTEAAALVAVEPDGAATGEVARG